VKLVNEVIDGLTKSCTACSPTCQFVAHLPQLGFEGLPSIASLEEIAEEVLERLNNSCTRQSPACYTLNVYVPHAGMQ
jgi:hypothetical protein